MLCYICGLDVGKVEIVTERGDIIYICSKCKSKKEQSDQNDNN